jgi:hypothetical protein
MKRNILLPDSLCILENAISETTTFIAISRYVNRGGSIIFV